MEQNDICELCKQANNGPRKIIQIAASGEGEDWYPQCFALCNDGTAWQLDTRVGTDWEQLPAIPQPTEES